MVHWPKRKLGLRSIGSLRRRARKSVPWALAQRVEAWIEAQDKDEMAEAEKIYAPIIEETTRRREEERRASGPETKRRFLRQAAS